MHLSSESVSDFIQYCNSCLSRVAGRPQADTNAGRRALDGHKRPSAHSRAFPAGNFKNRGSEKPGGMSFSICPVGGARQPQSGAGLGVAESIPSWRVRLEGDGGRGGGALPSFTTPGRGHGQFYQLV